MTNPSAEALFCALDGLDQCLTANQAAPARPDFSTLFRYVTTPTAPAPKGLDHPSAQADLSRLLQQHGRYHFPVAVAASSGVIVEREIDGLQLTLRTSQTATDQTYLILEHDDPTAPAPQSLFVLCPTQPPARLSLADFDEGYLQILLPSDHEIVKGLHHHESQVIVR